MNTPTLPLSGQDLERGLRHPIHLPLVPAAVLLSLGCLPLSAVNTGYR